MAKVHYRGFDEGARGSFYPEAPGGISCEGGAVWDRDMRVDFEVQSLREEGIIVVHLGTRKRLGKALENQILGTTPSGGRVVLWGDKWKEGEHD